ncbi:uncharacterized protein PHACADRAFT_191858 [Phanerochaete carnosa HHB-10118-sp]|uniref:Uncharacterized protein n=1 Tax=Phanerochaete carnosa (strain HHB-10118-sp) TaxID=650164 RepID=K5WJB5_PHACS|nr:uncharacterized protein PHACADRAFT_191858 [Phanerochaete carnosa HHB-10118-sp]EKM59490.1 hypothetical protein PHACADRAFT_191858 [Phanerochaete carnosa HHB-10118-sp]
MPEDRSLHSIPSIPEVDQHGGDDLPTYEDLASQNGPNSRFGRWKSWIEKRAAERYADLTPEQFERRRQKGWGEGTEDGSGQATSSTNSSTGRHGVQLHVQTDLSAPITPPGHPLEPETPQPSIGEVLSPTRLQLHQFGSRFLPHTTSQIRCLLPILGDTMLLVGHDEGLSILNMFPKEWSDEGLTERGPNDAVVYHVLSGESFCQMSLLEAESTGDGTPQGVVLALVGPADEPPSGQEGVKSIRMYNLGSLVSLAKWTTVQQPGALPLQLGIAERKYMQGRHHKSKPSLARGLKHLRLDSPLHQPPRSQTLNEVNASAGISPSMQLPGRSLSGDSAVSVDSSWDVVEDLPLRWATDYVPLAAPGTRLFGTSVLCYDVWRDPNERSRGVAYLAIVVKSNILLYHAPKGERAFRFVKEFYTPITARSITFVQQSVHDSMSRSPSDVTPRTRHSSSAGFTRHLKGMSVGGVTPFYPAQLSLFATFEKKAGLIRIADAAVGEVELYDDGTSSLHGMLLSSGSTTSLSKRSRASWDGRGFVKDTKAAWIPPCKVDFSEPQLGRSLSQSMYILTRGKQSHILPHPLPTNMSVVPPYRVIHWSSPPNNVTARISRPENGSQPVIHIVAFGDDGIEVQELSLSRLSQRDGKSREDEPLRVQADFGGTEAGFLVAGGHWHKPFGSSFTHTPNGSDLDADSDLDLLPEELADVMYAEQGIYGWIRKGSEDWRVIWLGGDECSQSKERNGKESVPDDVKVMVLQVYHKEVLGP